MMKRSLSVLLALLVLSCAGAQSSYFVLRVDVAGDPSSLSVVIPFPGLQLATPVLDDVELRGSLLLLLLVTLLQVDVLYIQNLSDTLRGYGGVGDDVVQIAFYDDGLGLGVHATTGVEYQLGSGIDLFGEVQPIHVLSAPEYLLDSDPNSSLGFLGKLNMGVNFHF